MKNFLKPTKVTWIVFALFVFSNIFVGFYIFNYAAFLLFLEFNSLLDLFTIREVIVLFIILGIYYLVASAISKWYYRRENKVVEVEPRP